MCNFEVELERYGGSFRSELRALAPHVRDGLVKVDGHRLTVTPLGRLFVRNVAMVFDEYLPRAENERRASKAI
jgi:oxygen-independent coproporphyrinogen-3 oxidase